MPLRTETINALREIAGTANVLTDVEDLYVYSFDQVYYERCTRRIDAVVRTHSQETIEKLNRLASDQDFIIDRREEIAKLENISKPLVMLDDSKLPFLSPISKSKKASTGDNHEFHGIANGNLMKHALAQRISFSNKPITLSLESNTCSRYCTVTSSFNGVETWSAKGRMLLIKASSKGEMPISPKMIDVLYTCSNCGLCFADCLQNSELYEAIRSARRQIVIKGLTPQIFKAQAKNILKIGNPGGTPQTKRLSWLKMAPNIRFKKKAEVLYWVGCTVATRTPNTAKAVVNILDYAKVDFTQLGSKEGCCGYILLASGLWDEAKKNATQLIEQVIKTEAKLMVTSCAGCYYTFSKLLKETLDIKLPCDIVHASQFVENLLREDRLDLRNLNTRVTYHDPCSLGRHANVFDAPRNVLNRIPELRFVEMLLRKNSSRCCGGGGGLWSYNNRVSMNSALNRLSNDVVPLNVDTLVTACPTCQMNLRYASLRKSLPFKVCDFAEIVEAALVNTCS
ncbi:MAG: (Fe-S)-binding protein [Candidatus Bathyarchaeota archaeon]|nr:MAG: (Fe-S)-binding protein [Candidatus Bathyarchaeota archaeon]